jgi:hypothetical protein
MVCGATGTPRARNRALTRFCTRTVSVTIIARALNCGRSAAKRQPANIQSRRSLRCEAGRVARKHHIDVSVVVQKPIAEGLVMDLTVSIVPFLLGEGRPALRKDMAARGARFALVVLTRSCQNNLVGAQPLPLSGLAEHPVDTGGFWSVCTKAGVKWRWMADVEVSCKQTAPADGDGGGLPGIRDTGDPSTCR